jgi:PAS domain S-box-containing protein
MDWRTSPYGFSLLVTAALSTSIFWYAYKRRKVPGAVPFALMMLAVTEWSLSYALELGSTGAAIKFFMLRVEFIGILIIPTAWLLFSLQYTGHGNWITPRNLIFLAIQPVAILLLVWTNEAHHLVWRSVQLETLGTFSILKTNPGGVYWFHVIYAYGLIFYSTYLILQAFLHSPSLYRRQSGIILAGAIVPWVGNILHLVNAWAFMALDVTPFAFTATGVAVAWGALRYGFLDIAPVARDRIFESLSDGVIVIDIRDRILDANQIAYQILGLSETELIGQSITKAFAWWSKQLSLDKANIIEGFLNQTEAHEEVSFGIEGEQSFFELHISPLTDRRGNVIGRLINWRDVSEQKRVEDALRLSEESYRQSVEKSPNPILSVNRDGFIQSWNPACEKVYLYDQHILGQHYSVLLHKKDDRSAVKDNLVVVFEQKQSLNELELTYRCKDGSLRFMVSRLYPIVDQEGKVLRCIVANTDITDRKQAEELLRKQLSELSVLHAAASACVEAANEDHLLERITRIVGETLFPDNFGVLLLDEATGALHFHHSYRGLPDELKSNTIQPPEGITGQVAASGQPCRVADVNRNPAYIRFHYAARSELCVPIKIGDQMIGVFNVESLQLDAFSEADERLLRILAGQLAIAIDRLRTEAAERRRAQELAAISQISRDITSVLDLQGVLDSIVRHAAEFSNADACGVFSYQPDSNLQLVAEYGASNEFVRVLKDQGVPIKGSALGRAIEERHPIQIPDLQDDPEYAMHDLATSGRVRAIMALPMLRGDEVIGGIVLWHRQPRRFTLEEEVFLQALAQQSVNAVENARLFEAEREQRKMAEALHEIGTALSATLDVDMILDLLLVQVERIVPYDTAAVMLLENGIARVTRTRGFDRFGEDMAQQVKSLSFDIHKTVNLQQLVEMGHPMLIQDIAAYPGWNNEVLRLETHSWIGTPIKDQGKIIAMFSLDKIEVNYYRPEHVQRLEIFAGQAGLALQNARLFDETQHRLHEVALLGRVIALTASAYDLPSALSQVCTEVARFFEVPQAGFALLNPERTTAEVIAEYREAGRPSGLGLHIPVSGNPSMLYILEHKIPLVVMDAQNDPLMEPIHDVMRQRDVASILIVPILLGEQVVGTLGIDGLEQREFSQADVDLMQKVATQVGQALERVRLLSLTQEHADRMAGLAVLSEELNRNFTVAEVIQGIGQGIMSLSGTDRAVLYLRSSDDSTSCPWYQGISPDYIEIVLERIREGSGGSLLQSSEPVLISDVSSLPEGALLRDLAREENYQSVGIWPLVYEGQVIAAVGCYYGEPQYWPEPQRETILTFARQAVIALQNARLFEETRRRAVQQEALSAIIAAAATAPDVPTLLETALDFCLRALGLERGGIWIDDFSFSRGLPVELSELSLSHSNPAGYETSRSLVVDDWELINAENLLEIYATRMRQHGVRASLTIPILAEGIQKGELILADGQPRSWLYEEAALIEAVGRQLGSAVERLNLLVKTQEQAHQVQQIVDTVPEGVLLLGREMQILVANPAARQYLGELGSGVDGKQISGVGDYLAYLAGQPVADLLYPGATWTELEVEGSRRNVFEVAAQPLNSMWEDEGWVLVLRDVTQERETLTRIQMQERLATVGQLAAGIAHDFNNIMAAIVVYTDLLMLEPHLSSASHERLTIIQQQVQRAASLIRQILDFSRRAVLEHSRLNLLPFIKELDKMLGRVLPENIRLELKYQTGEFMVNADPTRLQQVFMNLALNARDAMPSGGTLHFELERVYLRPGESSPLPDLSAGYWICIKVSDTGIGIPPDVLPHIFEPFFTTKPVGKGTGLGLAQVYGIVKQHGGSIDVNSRVGEGTTFNIYLPALDTFIKEPEEVELTADDLKGAGETILLVEDDEAARNALRAMLEQQNYHVLVASDGVEGIKMFEQASEPVALVVSDVVMPDMGGMEMYRVLCERQPQIKLLFVTGHPLEEKSQELLEGGRVHWLQKPFSIVEFNRVARTLLEETN